METDIEISENIIKEKNIKIIITEKNSKYYIEKLHFLIPNVNIFYKFNLINNININTINNNEIINIINKYIEISLFAENLNFNVLFFNIDYNVINDNKRIDNYGGSKENKIKLILEIIKKIKDKVKNNFLLYLNININILNLI